MARLTPFLLILLFVGVFALIMLSFTFLGNHTIYIPNQTEVSTPELNQFEEDTAGQMEWVYKVLWGLLIAILLFAVALTVKMFLRRKGNW